MTPRKDMHPDVLRDILSNLKRDYGFREVKGYLRQGTCPDCGEKELFVSAAAPWVVKCGRDNKCGWSETTRKLYPDAFGRLNERYPATTEKPDHTADMYMALVRGFPLDRIKGWYRQGQFRHSKGSPRETATVVFDIDRQRGILMERLIDPVHIKKDDGKIDARRANFVGDWKGMWWTPPGQVVTEGELWLVEGCMKAIPLRLMGKQVAATLSASHFPEDMLKTLDPKKVTLVWALDDDPAGRKFIPKHRDAAKKLGFESHAAIVPAKDGVKMDWDDAWRAGKLKDEDFDRYRFHGDLLLAESALEKGVMVWRHRKSGRQFAVEFDNQLFWFEGNATAYETMLSEFKTDPGLSRHPRGPEFEAALKSAQIESISNCSVRFLYFMRDVPADESFYYAEVKFPHGRNTTKSMFRASEVASSSGFKERLMKIAPGALWTGSTHHLNWIARRYLDRIKTVDTVDFTGYSAEHKAWILNNKAVAGGQVYDLNDEDFFEIGKKSVRSTHGSLALRIGTASDYDPSWVGHLHTAYGARGIVAAAYWLLSLFAEQVREGAESLFFLEIVGEAGAGKTTLIEFLWKLVGRANYEGFDPNKATAAARGRAMTQVAGLPVVLIESDRERRDGSNSRQFDWDELKSLFDGHSPRMTAQKNNSNDTKEPPFRGSVVISQNAAVESSDAIMTRIVHLHFTTRGHRPEGRTAAIALARMPVEKVSYFVLLATMAEAQIMKLMLDRAEQYEAQHRAIKEITTVRIQKNHAQARAAVDALAALVDMPAAWVREAHEFLVDSAKERQRKLAADHPLIVQFWDAVDFLGLDKLNHSRTPGRIAINLNHFQRDAARQNQSIPDLAELRKLFPDSRARPLVAANHSVSSGLDGEWLNRTVKCWIFKDSGAGTAAAPRPTIGEPDDDL